MQGWGVWYYSGNKIEIGFRKNGYFVGKYLEYTKQNDKTWKGANYKNDGDALYKYLLKVRKIVGN